MLALSAAAVTLLPLPMARSASADDGWVKVPVRFGPAGVHNLEPQFACDAANLCAIGQVYDRIDLVGDLTGPSQQSYAYASSAEANWFILDANGTFRGKVNGCGTGSIMFTTHYAGAPGPSFGTFVFDPRSGTGDLKGLSGSATEQPDGSLTGVLRCRRPHH
jgi:hypothetical protein